MNLMTLQVELDILEAQVNQVSQQDREDDDTAAFDMSVSALKASATSDDDNDRRQWQIRQVIKSTLAEYCELPQSATVLAVSFV